MILFSKPLSQTTIAIYTVSGLKVYNSKINKGNNEIDMSKYVSGLYFVKIVSSDKCVITKKIIKQ